VPVVEFVVINKEKRLLVQMSPVRISQREVVLVYAVMQEKTVCQREIMLENMSVGFHK